MDQNDHFRVRVRPFQRHVSLLVERQMVAGSALFDRSALDRVTLARRWAGYLAKYIAKDFAAHHLDEKQYWTSRGVVVPERMPIDHILSDDPAVALKIAFDAARRVGAPLDRCQVFWRQELGVFWLSTREAA